MTPPRSDHFNGKTFFQRHTDSSGRVKDLLRWRMSKQSKPWPRRVDLPPRPGPKVPENDEVVLTWIGHSSFLVRTTRICLLLDPVFSERVSPLSWIGPRRVHPPGVELSDLPKIDAVLLSHDHYDHFDLPSVRSLAARHNPVFIAPLRHEDLLSSAGARRIVELDWWQTHRFGAESAASCTLTPSKHWSNRIGSPRNHRLWGGFHLELGMKRIWFVGDSGYDREMARAVRERRGAPDVALMPIGAYEPRWFMAPMHMDPAEAVQTHREVGARQSIGMHWGTFQLTDEGRDEPVQDLARAREAAGISAAEFSVLTPGESRIV